MERQHCRYKKALILKIQFTILMELTIHGRMMIRFPISTQHHGFSRKINRKNYDIQIDVVHIFSRFNRIKKHVRINLAMTNNMSTYANYSNNDRYFIGK